MAHASLNHTYRLVWNDAKNAFVAVAENVKGRGKSSRSGPRLGAIALAAASAILTGATCQLAAQTLPATLPTGGSVVSGSASIATNGSTMTVTQTTARMAADWQSFNIGQGHTVNFVQPSASSVALNRVLGADVSLIQGALNANGQVFLINPNGVLFTPTAQVNVGGIVASTLSISTADFMAGNYKFEGNSTNAIVNQGRITALGDGSAGGKGGTVALIAAKITNTGSLIANEGSVLMGAGSKVTLDLGGPVKLQVEQGALDALIEQGGAIKANGGLVYLTAKAASSLASSVINHTGVTEAKSLSANARGEIVLESGHAIINTGTLDVSGVTGGQISIKAHNLIDAGATLANGQGGDIRIDVTGRVLQTTAATLQANGGNSGKGGNIRIQALESAWLSGSLSATGYSGGDISLTAPVLTLTGTKIDASGAIAGGRIRAGGGWQGKDTDLANAQRTRVVAAELDVSSVQRGNGGIAVVWSDVETLFSGHIAAKGGALGGNGGLVEVSSHDKLSFGGLVDASAPNGSNGRLLLDPKNIEIVNSGSGFSLLSLPDPTPSTGESFGANLTIVELKKNGVSTGRIVVASPLDDAVATDAGAVYLYNSQTGALISTLTGSTANDQVGNLGVTALTNGNYVVRTSTWDNGAFTNAGAVTWGNGSTGTSGVVSDSNSLVGSTASDQVGSTFITALTNGNYVVASMFWDKGAITDAGAVTWGNGSTGTSGVVSASNSLVGSSAGDIVGEGYVTALTNGNYVVISTRWANGANINAGAVTWGNGSTGTSGVVSDTNSLVGNSASDIVGSGGITALTNGNYVVRSSSWGNGAFTNAGAVTWGNGSSGTSGVVSDSNSLVGSKANDQVGSGGVTALTNGNYVVSSSIWDNVSITNAGAVTWGNGSGGTSGVVSASNSLVGSTANDQVGNLGVTALTNGNYVVRSSLWDNVSITNAGAVTWGNGSSGTSGVVSASNSLVGSTASDQVGNLGVTALTNGNYVVASSAWDNVSITNAGAVTWGNGSSGTSGVVSASNSLVGSTASDNVGNLGVIALTNGNYVVRSTTWDNVSITDAGAVTWGNGSGGTSGVVSASNSLVGSKANDQVGSGGVTALTNGNYVVRSSIWDNVSITDAGAVTWGNGSGSTSGVVSASNSLVGSTASDQVGNFITALTNGNYVVRSTTWDSGAITNAGAVTWGNGSGGTSGAVSASNSLLGSTASDALGSGQVIALADGRALIGSPAWDNGSTVNAGRVDILSAPPSSLPLSYATTPSTSSSVLASTLLATLNAGTAVTLQANNDITLSTALAVNNAGGNGGALTLQAGRSILLNADLSTDNGDLTLIANDRAINGVVDAYRDAGAANITQLAGTTINAGTGTVTIDLRDGAGNTNNTAGNVTLASITAGNLTVQSRGFNASATASNKTYDGEVAAALTAVSLTGLAFQTGSNLSAVNPITGSFASANAGIANTVTSAAFKVTGYNASQSSDLLKDGSALTASSTANIDQRPITVTADAKTKTYGEANPALTYTVAANGVGTSQGLVNGDTLTGTLSRTAGENVGSYTINAGALANGNYMITANNGTLSITKAHLTVTAANASKTYGEANPALSTTLSGFVNGEVLGTSGVSGSGAATTIATMATGAGTATITAAANNLSANNYDFTNLVDGTLSINQRPITVTADAKTKTYGEANPALTYTVAANGVGTSQGLVNGDTLTGTLSRTAGENVGSYTINAGALANGNYMITANNGTLRITAAQTTTTDSPAQQYAIQTVQTVQTAAASLLTDPVSKVKRLQWGSPPSTVPISGGCSLCTCPLMRHQLTPQASMHQGSCACL